jgi:hypothetical protein
MKHATVMIGGAPIPLIGVPREATMETCDICQRGCHLQQVHFNGNLFICDRCLKLLRIPKATHATAPA